MRLLPGLAVLPLIAAAGTGAGAGAARRATPPATTHTVEMRNFVFAPSRLDVAAGDTVVWINRDAAPHTATDSRERWNSGGLGTGDRWTWIAEKAGRFDYRCAYHPSMAGVIRVRR